MSDDQRKATDILLSLEEKIDNIIKIVAVYDMNTKIILDRTNKMFSAIENVSKYIDELKNEAEQLQNNGKAAKPNEQIQEKEIIPEQHIQVSEIPMNRTRISREVKIADKETNQDKKVPITQRITDTSGKDLFMAQVDIIDSEDKIVHKTKTNAAGKWQAYLRPGQYNVKITKVNSATKEKVETSQKINIENSNSTIVLPTAIINR